MSETDEQIERARSVKARHANRLLALPGVVGVGVGLRQRGGVFTDEIAIIVTVRRKRPPGEIPPAETVPAELEGVPVDVQEVGEISARSV